MRKPQSQEKMLMPMRFSNSEQLFNAISFKWDLFMNLIFVNILQKSLLVFLFLSLISSGIQAQIASAPANTKSPWVDTYTNLAVSSANNNIPVIRPVSVSGANNVINASTIDFATVNITGIGGVASISVKDNDAADTYPAGTFAGFRVGSGSLLSATLASTVTIRTYNNNTLAETYNAVASLVDVSSLLLNSDGTATLGFITKQPFDEIEIEYGALVGLFFSADVYNAVIERFVAGSALSCNVQTPAVNPTYPTYINSVGTGIGGVCVGCSVTDAENVVSTSTSDFATISMVAGLGSTGSLAVRDAITTYPAGTFTGFNISNPGLISANLLSGISIETYKTTSAGVRTLVETSSTGSLLSVGTFLSGSGAQTVGFVTTLPFDEVRLVMSNLLGVLSTTNVYNVVYQNFCAGVTPTCDANTNLVNPAYPAIIDGAKSGIGGVACVACSVNNSQNVIDSDLSNSASIVLAAGLLANGSIAVKDQLTTYVAGTFAGFDIDNVSLIGVNLLGGVTITTYLNGVQKETSGGNLISLQLLSSSRQVVGFTTTQAFDEVKITVGNFASINLGSTIVYSAVLRGPSAAGTAAPIITATTLSNTCPTTTVSLGGLANTGTKPAGASLIWSTNKVPTSAGDTLTNLTTVSAGGKYYAMYYDKVKDCYSQADSVTVTINSCSAPLCNLSVPILLPLGLSKLLPAFCIKGSFDYYKESILDLTNYIAISPNGNTFAPTSVNVDATQLGIYTKTTLANTTTLAPRMALIDAPGTYSVNGGVKVRIYYSPMEFVTLPTAYRTWFKHPAHVKATILGDLTATGLTNAVAITPDSTGTENGIDFVQFNNIQNFSTFGYMGSTVSPCVAGTNAPIISATTLTNTCPTTTVDLSSLPNTGTKPSGTTLVWSTNKVPTSAGDTLTNLTSVSTAGKYYAMYFDKAGDCYSPADSVTVTIATCPAVGAAGTVVCSSTQMIPAPVAGTASNHAIYVTVNVTTAGTFSPVSVTGSGFTLSVSPYTLTTTTTGAQTFIVPVHYDGTTLTNNLQFTLGAAGSCVADMTKPAKVLTKNVYSLDGCTAIVPGVITK